MNKILSSIWSCLFILIFLSMHKFYANLPDLMASHFNYHGLPDHYQNKQAFHFFFAAIVLLLNLFIFGMSVAIKKMPMSLINWPHKDWWMETHDRQWELQSRMKQIVQTQACLMNLIFLGSYLLTIDRNTDLIMQICGRHFEMKTFILLVAIVVIALLGHTLAMLKRPRILMNK